MLKAAAVAMIEVVLLALLAVAATTATNFLSVVAAMPPLLVCALAFQNFLLKHLRVDLELCHCSG